MCIAAPGKVIEVKGRTALVEYSKLGVKKAMVGSEKVKAGSYVLVQMGIIVEVLSKSQASKALKAWQ